MTSRISLRQPIEAMLTLLTVVASLATVATGKRFNLGILLPYTGTAIVGREAAGAIGVALQDVNSDTSLTALRAAGHTLAFDWRDSQCDEAIGLEMLVDLWTANGQVGNPVDAFIGTLNNVLLYSDVFGACLGWNE